MINKSVFYPKIGEVRFQCSKRARRINISVRNNRSVRVAVPMGVSLRTARHFFNDHQNWVMTALRRIRDSEPDRHFLNGDLFRIRSRQFVLNIRQDSNYSFTLNPDTVMIRYPRSNQIADLPVQNYIKLHLIEVLRKEAKKYLPLRLAGLAQQYGFRYNKIFIKNLRSRWGSCSTKNNINLNLQLMRFSDEIIDYILLHELMHTQIKNHSPKFWQGLTQIYPDAISAKHYLKIVNPYKI